MHDNGTRGIAGNRHYRAPHIDNTVYAGDYGYTLWAESLRKPLLKILKKYGIK